MKRHLKFSVGPIDGFQLDNNIITDSVEIHTVAKSHYQAQFASHPLNHSDMETETENLDLQIENVLETNRIVDETQLKLKR